MASFAPGEMVEAQKGTTWYRARVQEQVQGQPGTYKISFGRLKEVSKPHQSPSRVLLLSQVAVE